MTDLKLKEAKEKVRTLSLQAYDVATNKDSKFATPAEQKAALEPLELDIKKYEDEVADLSQLEAARKRFAGLSASGDDGEDAGADKGAKNLKGKSIGMQFVESKGYKDLIEAGLKGTWRSADIELKAPLLEGTLDAPGDGYSPATIAPTTVPGIVDTKFRPLTLAALFPGGSTSSPVIQYLVETIAQNGAAGTHEGSLKPESRLKFAKAVETLAKITTFLPVSDEMLEDYEQIQSYINGRLGLFVSLEEERQILEGEGGDEDELLGILNRTGLAPLITQGSGVSAASDNAMDAIYRQITAIRITQFMEPDAIAIDPIGWENIMLSKATGTGNYFAGGPFLSEADRTLWGKRVAETPLMDTKTALVGAYAQGGQIFRKGGLTVAASNSHEDFFQRNLTAIRAEERAALAIYRPGAFGLVDLT